MVRIALLLHTGAAIFVRVKPNGGPIGEFKAGDRVLLCDARVALQGVIELCLIELRRIVLRCVGPGPLLYGRKTAAKRKGQEQQARNERANSGVSGQFHE